jgi:hypothetical protein
MMSFVQNDVASFTVHIKKQRENSVILYGTVHLLLPLDTLQARENKIVPLLPLQRYSPSLSKTNKTHNHGLLPDEKTEGTSPAGNYLMVVWPPYPCIIIGQR